MPSASAASRRAQADRRGTTDAPEAEMSKLRSAAVLGGSFLFYACGEPVEGAAHGIELGTVAMAWTIEGSTDPASCIRHEAPWLRVVVEDTAGVVRAERIVPCSAFGANVELRAGLYRIEATFEDAGGGRASATARVGPFAVEPNERSDVALAFTDEMMAVDKIVLTSR